MRILLIPGYERNPYLSELAIALRGLGLDVKGVGGLGPAGFRERIKLFAGQDIVHIHWTHQYIEAGSRAMRFRKAASFLLCVAVARSRGTRFVWTVHNVFAHRKGDVPLERRFARALARLASGCIVHCSAAKEEVVTEWRLGQSAATKFTVIPHGHFIHSYPQGISREEAREHLGLGLDVTVFLQFGAVLPYKGLDALLDAFLEVDSSTAKLVIAGPPKSSGYAERIAHRASGIAGVTTTFEFVPDEKVQIYMSAADAVVLPYENALTSGAAVLAMSFGRAVITPELGCARTMLSQQTELLYPPGDQRALARALQVAMTVELDEVGKRNLESSRAHGWEDVAARTADVYRVAARPSRG